ncbi:RNA-binding protein with multiple splicing 2, variant 2 [Balamuthia mandrillaris]
MEGMASSRWMIDHYLGDHGNSGDVTDGSGPEAEERKRKEREPSRQRQDEEEEEEEEREEREEKKVAAAIRTLYLTGFPSDVKGREIHNLFRPFAGYEDSVLKSSGVVFATFVDQSSALVALQALNGIYFDPDSSVRLRVELAKANSQREPPASEFWSPERVESRLMRLSRSSASTNNSLFPMKRQRTSSFHLGGLGEPVFITTEGKTIPYSSNHLSIHTSSLPYEQRAPSAPSYAFNDHYQQPFPFHESHRMARPCRTLFVSGLEPEVTEADISELFSQTAGYVRAQMYTKNNRVSAFVQYLNVEAAMQGMQALQGKQIQSWAGITAGPIHIECVSFLLSLLSVALSSLHNGEG